jgi:hypothetical protein
MSRVTYVETAARKLLVQFERSHASAIAFVAPTAVGRIIVRLRGAFTPQLYPERIFETVEDGRSWLEQFASV